MSINSTRFLTAYESFVNEIFLYFFMKTRERETAKQLTQEAFRKTWHEILELEANNACAHGLRAIHKILRRNAEILIMNRDLRFAM